MWRQIQAYLFPGGAERDEGFRQEVFRLSRIALLVIGGIQIGVSMFMLLARFVVSPESSTLAFRLRQAAVIIALGIVNVALSRLRTIQPYARLIAAVSGLLTATVLLWASLLIVSQTTNPDDFIPGQITLVMLVAITTVPLRPVHTFALGSAIGVIYVISTAIAQRVWHAGTGPDDNYILFIVMLTLLCTAITAVVYQQRRANYELRESQARMLIAENASSMAQLAAALSHEMNNPMGALLSGVDTLLLLTSKQATCSQQEQARLVLLQADIRRSIQQSAERLKALVNRIQRFTNLDQAEVQSANVNELLADVAALLQPQLSKTVKIQLDLKPVPPVVCRPQQMSAVFNNLVTNAVRALNNGDGLVTITTRPQEQAVEVEIRDNGRGLDPKELSGIFDPGFRVSGSRMAAANWGMFTSRQIIREHGGDIRIASGAGAGTVVTVSLPAAAAAGTAPT
jgi:signal transduction histidine kinase